MKNLVFLFLLVGGGAVAVSAQAGARPATIEATTADGRAVELRPDGTWEFKKFDRLGVTAAGFAALKDGMSYETVVMILGREGEVVSSSSLGEDKTVMYSWKKPDKGSLGASMNAIFQNGRLMSKSQYGLK